MATATEQLTQAFTRNGSFAIFENEHGGRNYIRLGGTSKVHPASPAFRFVGVIVKGKFTPAIRFGSK